MLVKAVRGFLIRKRDEDEQAKRFRSTGLNWFRIKYLKHVDQDHLKFHQLFGKGLAYRNGGELMSGLIELFAHEIYKINLPANAKIIDCGANIGLSVLYLKRQHPDARITAFEPDPINFDLLEKNVATYNLQGVELRKEAVWNKDEILHFDNAGSQASKISENVNNSVEVKAIRLKDLINEKIDFLKIDIEGAEYKVLTDIEDRLHFVDQLFVEYHGKFDQNGELIRILEIISRSGFHFYIKDAADAYRTPFDIHKRHPLYDLQLNIFCLRNI